MSSWTAPAGTAPMAPIASNAAISPYVLGTKARLSKARNTKPNTFASADAPPTRTPARPSEVGLLALTRDSLAQRRPAPALARRAVGRVSGESQRLGRCRPRGGRRAGSAGTGDVPSRL